MRYISNEESLVIHDRQGSTENCNRDALEHGRDIDVNEVESLLKRGANTLCRYCFADNRFGEWKKSPATSDSVTSSPGSHS